METEINFWVIGSWVTEMLFGKVHSLMIRHSFLDGQGVLGSVLIFIIITIVLLTSLQPPAVQRSPELSEPGHSLRPRVGATRDHGDDGPDPGEAGHLGR